MIVLIEPLCWGIEHTPVNAAILEICQSAFPDQPIRFCAERQHLREVQKFVGDEIREATEWLEIDVPSRHAHFRERFPVEFRLMRTHFHAAQATGGYALLLSAVESTVFALRTLYALSGPRIPVQAVLHGYLNEITGWRSRNPFIRAFDLRSALCLGVHRHLKYLVLESSIARRLLEILPRLDGYVDWVPHPIPREGRADSDVPALPVNVSFLGLASREKGFDAFVNAAEQVIKRCPGQIRFHAIGRKARNEADRESPALSTRPRAEGLSRSEYVDALRSTHYVCLPYQGRHYELAASGVLLDAIAWCKPIVSMPSPVIDELFALHPGIGYLCKTAAEMAEVLSQLAAHFDERTYRAQVQVMSDVRESRLPRSVAKHYRQITEAFRKNNRPGDVL
jgi:glycosyltransferase involved in cell wall biosynthesis